MGNRIKDNADVIALPPLIYAVPLVAGLLLHLVFPAHFLPDSLPLMLGGPLVGIAIVLSVWAHRVMVRAGTNVNPYKPSMAIVTEGPYRFTRNPMYLAMTLFYLGIAALVNALWLLLLLPIVWVVIRWGVIGREERYLEKKFGAEYVQYKSRVRRWV